MLSSVCQHAAFLSATLPTIGGICASKRIILKLSAPGRVNGIIAYYLADGIFYSTNDTYRGVRLVGTGSRNNKQDEWVTWEANQLHRHRCFRFLGGLAGTGLPA